jgi:hypothetical protein
LPIRNSSCLRLTLVTPHFVSKKLGSSGRHGLVFTIALAKERVDGVVWFWIGPINLGRHTPERYFFAFT